MKTDKEIIEDLSEQLILTQGRLASMERLIEELHHKLSKSHSALPKRRSVEKGQRVKLLALTGGICFYCRERLSLEVVTADHLIPLSKGGSNRFANYVPACFKCNNAKKDRMPTAQESEFAAFLHAGQRNVTRSERRARPRPHRASREGHSSPSF